MQIPTNQINPGAGVPSLTIRAYSQDGTLVQVAANTDYALMPIWKSMYGENIINTDNSRVIKRDVEYSNAIVAFARQYPGRSYLGIRFNGMNRAPSIELGIADSDYSEAHQIVTDQDWVTMYGNNMNSQPAPVAVWTPPASSSIQLPNTNVLIAAGGAVILLFLLLLRR